MSALASRVREMLSMLGCVAVASLMFAAPNAQAQCAGFPDVVNDGFCANVEWIKNRQVTLGCGGGAFCPYGTVTRLQMAAFMNRLGTALTPIQVRREAITGPMDPDLNPVVCPTDAFTVTNYPRRAFVDGALSALGAADAGFGATLVMSTNGGASWQPMNAEPSRGSVLAGQWSGVSDIAYADLDVGTSVTWGLRVSRAGIASSGDLSDGRCQLRSLVYSRDGSASPL